MKSMSLFLKKFLSLRVGKTIKRIIEQLPNKSADPSDDPFRSWIIHLHKTKHLLQPYSGFAETSLKLCGSHAKALKTDLSNGEDERMAWQMKMETAWEEKVKELNKTIEEMGGEKSGGRENKGRNKKDKDDDELMKKTSIHTRFARRNRQR